MRRAALILATAFLLAGVFVLPYQFPPASPILSASLLAGFNNSVAYACYVAGLGALGLLLANRFPASPVFSRVKDSRVLFGPPPPFVVGVMAAHALLFFGLYLWKHGFFFAEALYFQETAYRVEAGTRPFVDFNFFYGPALVYPTAFLARYLGLQPAYALYYIGSYLLGLYFLYVLLAALIDDRRWVVGWFLIFAVGFFNPITGLNYTLTRFLLPPVSLLAVWRCRQRRTASRMTAASLLLATALLCSPDIGIVALLAAGVTVAAGLFADRAVWDTAVANVAATGGAIAAGIALAGAALLVIDGTTQPVVAYLRPILTFSAGGWNTPIDPSVPMLTLLGFGVMAAAILWRTWCADPASATAPLAAGYAAMFVLMERAIFGKADVEHIAFSGLPSFCLAACWSVAGVRGRGRGTWAAAALVVGVIVPLQFYHAMLFLPSLMHRTAPIAAPASDQATAASSSKEAVQASLSRAVEHFGPDQPYYMHKLEYYRLPIYLRYRLKPVLYQPSLTSAFTRQDIEGVIAELQHTHAVVLARRADIDGPAAPAPPSRWWNYITSSPLPGSTVFTLTLEFQSRLEAPLVRFLNGSYDRRFEDGDVVGLVLRQDTTGHAVQ